jgi:hypothetical protein
MAAKRFKRTLRSILFGMHYNYGWRPLSMAPVTRHACDNAPDSSCSIRMRMSGGNGAFDWLR